MIRIIYILVLFFTMYSCRDGNDKDAYSFFVAGHTYGKPGGDNPGLHPPFLEIFEWLNNQEDLEFGILTGDIVRSSNAESWDSIDVQLSRLYKKVYFCPGNHDTYNRELYESRYGNPYYAFNRGNDLFIILDGNMDRWNVCGEQLDFLGRSLSKVDDQTNHVFIFVHQLIWWDEHNIFSRVSLNWPPYTPDTTNYWPVVEPMLQTLKVPVVLFAGDLGANNTASSIMYHRDRNITYIASGMGNGNTDNFIVVTVGSGEKPVYKLISLGKGTSDMGVLEDYDLE